MKHSESEFHSFVFFCAPTCSLSSPQAALICEHTILYTEQTHSKSRHTHRVDTHHSQTQTRRTSALKKVRSQPQNAPSFPPCEQATLRSRRREQPPLCLSHLLLRRQPLIPTTDKDPHPFLFSLRPPIPVRQQVSLSEKEADKPSS